MSSCALTVVVDWMNIDTAHPMIKITSAKLAAAKMRDLRGSPSPKGQKIVEMIELVAFMCVFLLLKYDRRDNP